ncbi:winged helix-turn-helix transcriptional regulator [Amycolatopsis umgeniensis]|uniref:DNA-binding HxlR family transcriptional regulator n=1 Tax=Amycolatopsis umgeniensis TaxID=336628 RepID=A0A841BFY5_9PSEU|nr:helix-turn-helix domain-containing protein [Amycolatopsis umgeniensis]MBB5857811.1 DNA-binding HxlR family transcriptional regulator [Amycolatopsis umgeniensis]
MPDDPIPRPGRPVRGSETGRPLMAALDLLGRRWTLRVIWELRSERLGFRELQRRCERMSSSVLTTRLGELAEARIVETDDDGYALTPLGEQLLEALHPLEKWGLAWEKALRE